jgi:hypothetical protein
VNVLGGNYPLRRDFHTFYFGEYSSGNVNNYSPDKSSPGIIGLDTEMAVSWQGLLMPSGNSTSVSLLLDSGNNEIDQQVLTVVSLPPYLIVDHLFSVDLMITDSVPGTNNERVFVLDGDVYGVRILRDDCSPGSLSLLIDVDSVSSNVAFGDYEFYLIRGWTGPFFRQL